MKEENIRLYVIGSTLFMLFMLIILMIILWIVVMDHYQTDFDYVCDKQSGLGFWFYRDEYARDMTNYEKRRYCPVATKTATPFESS